MAESFVRVEDGGGGVRIVRLDRPPMNALSNELAAQLRAALDELRDDASVKALVVWGGEKVFCAGADVKDMHTALQEGRNPGPGIVKEMRPTMDALAAFPRATFAAITGYALGGGLEVALSCDFRIVAETARVGFPEIALGIFPGAGGTQRLPRLVGPARAKWIIFGGQNVKADEALSWGLVDMVVPQEQVLERTVAEATRLASGAVAAQALAKTAIDGGLDAPIADGLDLENRLFEEVYTTDDAKTGVASFVEQGPGKAAFAGR